MFRHRLGALALAVACALPLAASAQTAPTFNAPGGAPGAQPPAPAAHAQRHHRYRRDPYASAMRGLNLTAAQRQQIAGLMKSSRDGLRRQIDGVLTPGQRTQLHAKLAQARRNFVKPTGPAPQAPPQ